MMPRLLAALLLSTALGCGQKGPPVDPQLVVPTAPSALLAASAATGVTLTWRRPLKYSGGGRMRDLARCLIERAPDGGGDYTQIGTLELDDRLRFRPARDLQWTDTTAVRGETYRYRVVAETLDGDQSPPSESVRMRFDPTPPKP